MSEQRTDRIAVFTQDKGPTALGGLITLGGTDLRCKLIKMAPTEKAKAYIVIELKEAPYSIVGGGFLWPSKHASEGGAVMYGKVEYAGQSYKVNLYKADTGKSYVFSGPCHLDDESAPSPSRKAAPAPKVDSDDEDW